MEKDNTTTGSEISAAPDPEELGSHVCDVCMGDNLLKASGIRGCARCKNPFCMHFMSKAMPTLYCVSCMSALELIRSVETKVTEHYNENTDKTVRYTQRARKPHLQGEDWLFMQRRIRGLSDAEIDMIIEVHRQDMMLLISEKELRRAEHMHRNAGVRVVINPGSGSTTKTVVTTVKQVSTTKMDKTKEKAAALLAQLMGGGLSMDQIQQMFKQKP